MPSVLQLFDAALARRAPLIESGRTEAIRLFHGAADGIDGLVLERFGPALFVQLHEGRCPATRGELRAPLAELCSRVGATSVYVKHHVRDRARATPEQEAEHRNPNAWIGPPLPEEFEIREDDRRYCIRPYDGFSVGLFLEHRDHRALVAWWCTEGLVASGMGIEDVAGANRHTGEPKAGRQSLDTLETPAERASAPSGFHVLNTFSYSGGFTVAAAMGGVAEVTSVDLSKRFLDWTRRNLAANGLSPDAHLFICDDVRNFYRRATRQQRSYDVIILDPPTFARMKRPRGVFVLEEDLDDLLAGAIGLLRPGGRLLFSTNHRTLPQRRIDEALARAAAGRRLRREALPPFPLDFAGDTAYSRTMLVRAVDA